MTYAPVRITTRPVGDFQHCQIYPGINLYVQPSQKIDLNYMSVFIRYPLGKEATQFALLSFISKKGFGRFATPEKKQWLLDSLHYKHFSSELLKIGNFQILNFNLIFPPDRVLPRKINALRKAVYFVKNLFSPSIEKYLPEAKQELKTAILHLRDDPQSYAISRCLSHICKNEPEGISEMGNLENIEYISCDALTEFHKKNIMKTSLIDLFLCGNVSPEKVARSFIYMLRKFKKRKPVEISQKSPPISDIKPSTITEQEDIPQSQVVLGFRTSISMQPEQIHALRILPELYARLSKIHCVKSLIEPSGKSFFVSAPADDCEKTSRLILAELLKIQAGEFDENEFEKIKEAAILRTMSQELHPIDKFKAFLTQLIIGLVLSGQERIDKIESISKQTIVEAACGLKLDTVFFLKSKNA